MKFKFVFISFLFLCVGCVRDEDQILNYLFSKSLESGVRISSTADKTFIIWVHGDADHWVTQSSVQPLGQQSLSGLKRADQVEALRIREAALQCENCNVVLLHVQRGGAHWYTADEPWATYLRVYVRGVLVLERHVPIVNGANPNLLSRLLQFSSHFFGSTGLHLIYRGHSFDPSYDPKSINSSRVAPFAYGFPESPYGVDQFKIGLSLAGLSQPLESVTIAACHMATVKMARALAPFAKYFLASNVDVLETLEVSFGFDFLARTDLMNTELGYDELVQVAGLMMDRFEKTQQITEAMMEYPMTVVDLTQLQVWDKKMRELLKQLQIITPDYWNTHKKDLSLVASVEKEVSDRYVQHLRNQGKSEASIRSLRQFVKMPSDIPGTWDVGRFLDFIMHYPPDQEEVSKNALEMATELKKWVRVVHSSSDANHKSGLSFRLEDYSSEVLY